jgi:hypothetical protein
MASNLMIVSSPYPGVPSLYVPPDHRYFYLESMGDERAVYLGCIIASLGLTFLWTQRLNAFKG